MPVYKYKSFKDAEKALWIKKPDSQYFRQIHELFSLSNKLNPVEYPNGVFLYKTFEDAQKQRLQWEVDSALRTKKKKNYY